YCLRAEEILANSGRKQGSSQRCQRRCRPRANPSKGADASPPHRPNCTGRSPKATDTDGICKRMPWTSHHLSVKHPPIVSLCHQVVPTGLDVCRVEDIAILSIAS